MDKPLEGKVAIVTGSGQGVGRGVAIALAREGAKVVTNDLERVLGEDVTSFRATGLDSGMSSFNHAEQAKHDALAGDAASTAAEIVAGGGEAIAFPADVTDFEASHALVEAALSQFGRIDILVNNAARLGFGPFATVTETDWHDLIGAKLHGTFNCTKHALPHMIGQGFGRILNTASDAWIGISHLASYGAANAAVVALTKSTAKELFDHGITVNAFCPQAASPGHVSFNATLRTMFESAGVPVDVDDEVMRKSEAAHGPAENLTFIAYLASDAAAGVSGCVFSVTAAGEISLYGEPAHVSHISKEGEPWTFDELVAAVPGDLLKGHTSVVERREF